MQVSSRRCCRPSCDGRGRSRDPREGGSAADAAVAAALASCVAETVMTGIAGGGYAVWLEAGSGRAEVLDFFVAVPGLGRPRASPGAGGARRPVRRGARPLLRRRGHVRRPGRPRRARRALAPGRHAAVGRPRGAGPAARGSRRDHAARARQVPRDARAGDDAPRGRPHLLAGRAAARGRRPARPARPRRRARGRRGRGCAHVLRRDARRRRSSRSWTSAPASSRRRTSPPIGSSGFRRPRRRTQASASRRAVGSRSSSTRSSPCLRLNGTSPADRAARARPHPGGAALQRADLRAHDEPVRRRPRRQRLRRDDQPRARLRRLPARLRRPPEQHARASPTS